jgi:site-specific recombinase XerD
MNNNNSGPTHSATCDIIEAQMAPFIARLEATGYAANTLCTKRVALRRFLAWRQRLKPPGKEPDESEVTEFLASSSQLGPKRRCLASTALSAFLEHLRLGKVITTCAPVASETASSALERRYADFLRDQKGLAELSLQVYLPLVANLLGYCEKQHGTPSVRRLNARTLRAFLFERARDRSSEYVRLLATSLRSFLRFLHAQGEIRHDLTAAIPTVRRWAQPGIPKKLTPEEVDRVLAAPDRTSATGRRDYAILLLLARLGLRSSEVLSLELGDMRWRTGEVLIRGKGGRQDLLPLPRDAGAAIARYLRLDRSSRPTPRVFLRTYAPRVPLTGPASIGHIVRRAMVQAGVERPRHLAAHLFRHTLASRMLQQGANLRDISEVLRHRAPSTTEIYAKIDMRSLQEVVRPWPAQGGAR